MTKKDFILIARAINDGRKLPIEIRECEDNPSYTSHEDLLANIFADRLAEVNPRFNRVRFLLACGLDNFNPFKAGDKVRYKDGDARIFEVYHIYDNEHVSLCIYGYNDVEQDSQVNIKDIEKIENK